jgi:hypothetical protein
MKVRGPDGTLKAYAEPLTGKTKDGEEAGGTITIPEVAHDTEEDEYVVCSLLRAAIDRGETNTLWSASSR